MPNDMTTTDSRLMLGRRQFAVGAAALLVTARSSAKERALTAESPMGPFFPLDTPADSDADMVWVKGRPARAIGDVIEIAGRVTDVRGNPIAGARLDIWQANAAGRYAHPLDISKAAIDPNFHGFASIASDSKGEWRITTIKPGGYDSPIGHRPPHIHFDIRGKAHRNVAQLYFPEAAAANARDRLYKGLGDGAPTSLAARDSAGKYRWDVVLLG